METRRLVFAMFAALVVYFTYMAIYNTLRPPPPPLASQPAVTNPQPGSETTPQSRPAPTSQPYNFTTGELTAPVTLGGEAGDRLEVICNAQAASMATIRLTALVEGKDRYVHRAEANGNEPYTLIQPVNTADGVQPSYVTKYIWVTVDGQTNSWALDGFNWQIVAQDSHEVSFETTLQDEQGEQLLTLRKSYKLYKNKPIIALKLETLNRSDKKLSVAFEQCGPVGVRKEHIQYNMRYLVGAVQNEEEELGEIAKEGSALRKPTNNGHVLMTAGEQQLAWVALANKYFAVVTRPLVSEGATSSPVRQLRADVADRLSQDDHRGDLRARLETQTAAIEPGQSAALDFEIYAGTMEHRDLEEVNPAFADPTQLNYGLLRNVSYRCCCTFASLTNLMTGLLENIYWVVGNYGLAIMVLVIIIRTLLHPLAVFQQKSMFRTQEGMSRVGPKLNELKKKYKDDKVKLNQEMMRLYAEENVNPAAPLVSMLPMLIQMPILIALWTGINTDINLRHAPFDGWWISDLSAPDALIQFSKPITIPIISWLPLIGFAFKDIPSFNLLPVLMGVSMWLQQKFMPKPHLEERLKQAKQAREEGREPEKAMGMTVEDQMRQQQIIANTMSIMFPLMFYYMPAGLNLYWMATNVYGIFESLRVRKQLDAEKAAKESGVVEERKPSRIAQFFKNMAEQAEDVQKKFDEIADQEAPSPRQQARDKKKQGKNKKKR